MILAVDDANSYSFEELERLRPFLGKEISTIEELVQVWENSDVSIALSSVDGDCLVIDHPFSW